MTESDLCFFELFLFGFVMILVRDLWLTKCVEAMEEAAGKFVKKREHKTNVSYSH